MFGHSEPVHPKYLRKEKHSPPVLVTCVGSVTVSLEGTVDNIAELSDEGPCSSLVVRYAVVPPCEIQRVVVVDP